MKKRTLKFKSPLLLTLVLGALLQVSLTPAESGSDVGGGIVSLLIRALAWGGVGFLAFFYSGRFFSANVTRCWSWLGLFFVLFFLSNALSGVLPLFQLLMVAWVLLGAALVASSCCSSERFSIGFLYALNCIVVFWVGAFLCQLIWFVISGDVLQIHSFFAPYSGEQRVELLGSGLARLGGVHIEPGTYVNWLFGVVLLRAVMLGDPFDRINVIAFTTMPVSMSFWGGVSFLFFVFAFFLARKREAGFYVKAVFAASFLFAVLYFLDVFSDFLEYYEHRSQIEDLSTEAKVDGFNGFWEGLDRYFLIGAGYSFDFCNGCLSPQDSGVFINMAVQIGFVGAVFFVSFLFYRFYFLFGFSGIFLLVPFLYAKWYYWDYVFWLIFSFSVCGGFFKKGWGRT